MQGICQKTRTNRIFYIVFNFSKLNLALHFFIWPKVEIARHQKPHCCDIHYCNKGWAVMAMLFHPDPRTVFWRFWQIHFENYHCRTAQQDPVV